MTSKDTYPVPVGLAAPDIDELVVHGAVTVTVQVSVTVGQVLGGLTGAAGVDDDGGGALLVGGTIGDSGVEDGGGGAGDDELAVAGQMVVETATTEVTITVSVCFSG